MADFFVHFRIPDGNFIVTGQIRFAVNRVKQIEYKYALRYRTNEGKSKYLIENSNDKSTENRSLRLSNATGKVQLGLSGQAGMVDSMVISFTAVNTMNVYDGMIFIPDEEKKKGMMSRAKSFLKNMVFSSSKDESAFEYKEMTDRAMLYQLDLLRTSSPDFQLIDLETFRNFERAVEYLVALLRYFIAQTNWVSESFE